MPNELQPQGVCELQGRRIEASGLPALMLAVDTRQWVLADNNLTLSKLIIALYRSQSLNASQTTCNFLGKFWYPSLIGSVEVSQ
jgi:hypothetical protein